MQFQPGLYKEAWVSSLPARVSGGISRARSWAAGALRVSAETWCLRLSARTRTLVSQTGEPHLVDAASFSGGSMGSSLINIRHLLGNLAAESGR